MGATVAGFILFLIGILQYLRQSATVLIMYIVLWLVIIPLLYDLIIGFNNEVEYYYLIQWIRYLGLFIFFARFFTSRVKTNYYRLCVVLLVVSLYAVYLSFYRGTGIISTTKYIASAYWDLPFLFGIIDMKFSARVIVRFIKRVLMVEFVVVVIQYILGISFYAGSTNLGMEINGTFLVSNIMAEFVTMLLYLVVAYDSVQRSQISTKNWVLIIASSFMVFVSGVRTALIAHIFVIGLLTLYIYRNNVKLRKYWRPALIIGSLVFYIVYTIFTSYISGAEVTYESQVTNLLERQNILASIFLDPDYLDEHTTFYYTLFVLSFFHQNPLLGPGLLYMSSSGYGGVVNEAAANLTDCTLALYICETGIIGIAFFVFVYWFLIKHYCKGSMIAILAFVYLLLITITDPGLFFVGNYLIFIIIILFANRNVFDRRLQKVL